MSHVVTKVRCDPMRMVTLTGTLITGSPSAADIVTGGLTIIFTVAGDQWVATLGDDNQITTDFLAAIDSAQAEATGWDAEVKANLTHAMLTRDSATQCTLVLPAAASYDITATETITASPPASSLLASSSPIVASPTFTVAAEAGAGLLMSSDWSTGIGSTDAAIRDTDKAVPWTSDVPTVLEVISASGFFAAGFTNCLKAWGHVEDSSGLWKIGALSNFGNVTYDAGVPEAGDHRYSRFYWRYDITDPPNNNDGISGSWGGTHPTEIGSSQGSVLHKMSMPIAGTTYQYIIVLFVSTGGTRTFYVTLDKATEYRIEEHLEFLSATSWYYTIRIYNAAGTLVFTNSDFTLWGHSTPMSGTIWYKRAGDYPMSHHKLGQNSSYTLEWDAGPERNIEMFKYGGFCLRSDTWCGPYAGGV